MNKKDILVNLGQFEDETSPKQQKVVLKFLECENGKKILKGSNMVAPPPLPILGGRET